MFTQDELAVLSTLVQNTIPLTPDEEVKNVLLSIKGKLSSPYVAQVENDETSRDEVLYRFVWEQEQEPDTSWMDSQDVRDYQNGQLELLTLRLVHIETGDTVDSLGNIPVFRGSQIYPRQVEQEMAEENDISMSEIERA